MGMVDITCAITGTGISYGNRILAVGTSLESPTSYSLRRSIETEGWKFIKFVGLGSFNGYLWLNEPEFESEEPSIPDFFRRYFFIHEAAIEIFLPGGLPPEIGTNQQTIEFLQNLLHWGYAARIDFFSLSKHGHHQFVCKDELIAQSARLRAIEAMISKQAKEYLGIGICSRIN